MDSKIHSVTKRSQTLDEVEFKEIGRSSFVKSFSFGVLRSGTMSACFHLLGTFVV